MRSKQEILDLIEEEDIEFIRLQFTDPLGNLKNVAVTSRKLEKVLDNQYAFENEKIFKIYEDELYLRPDLNTFAILPWRPQQSRV
ncbi:MAG: glutamine synthetase, partial [Lachnospiraceae bacterium]|nr:glutamine synthetase [Lachnospiraceae bacterium]